MLYTTFGSLSSSTGKRGQILCLSGPHHKAAFILQNSVQYSGGKAAVVNFNRSITALYRHEGIRTFTTCPSAIKTSIQSEEVWKSFAEEFFTPIEALVDAVMKLINGGDIKDSKGVAKTKDQNWG